MIGNRVFIWLGVSVTLTLTLNIQIQSMYVTHFIDTMINCAKGYQNLAKSFGVMPRKHISQLIFHLNLAYGLDLHSRHIIWLWWTLLPSNMKI